MLPSLPLQSESARNNIPRKAHLPQSRIDPFRLACALVVLMTIGVPMLVYFISSRQVQNDLAAYGEPYKPPAEGQGLAVLRAQANVQIAVKKVEQHRLEEAKKPIKTPERETDPSVASVDDEAHDKELARILEDRLFRLKAEGRLPSSEPPTTDPFGNPYPEDQDDVPFDPCATHPKPDFTSTDMQSLCADHEVSITECFAFLETSWKLGNEDIHVDFQLPEGCRP